MTVLASVIGQFQGRHVLAELYGIHPALLDDEERLCTLLREALTEAKATVVDLRSHHFSPQGVTVMALLSESHASLHTYPEYDPREGGACYVDFFTCGSVADPQRAIHSLSAALRPARYHIAIVDRGTPAPPIPHQLTL